MNPELRQTFNTISRNFESANEAAQVNFYDFTSHYIDPCIGGIKACFGDCLAHCFPTSEDHLRRKRGHSRGRADFNFDFYDDWEEEEDSAAPGVGWGNDELDSLLAGRGQPRAQRTMSYGARVRRNDPDADPTAIPKSSYLGFLDRLPFKIGARVLRYKPSSAGLQENPGGLRIRDVEHEALMEEQEPDSPNGIHPKKGHARNRSHTGASHSTTTSHSARSDLIMSDEDDDAIPLDDEFATVMLSRRTTSSGGDELTGTKSGSGKRPILSRVSTRSASSKSLHIKKTRRSSSKKSLEPMSPAPLAENDAVEGATTLDMKTDKAKFDHDELEIAMKQAVLDDQFSSQHNYTQKDSKPTSLKPLETNMATTVDTVAVQGMNEFSLMSPLDGPEGETEPFPDMSAATPKSETEEDIKPP